MKDEDFDRAYKLMYDEINRRFLAWSEIEDGAAKAAEGKRIVEMIHEAEDHCQWSGITGGGAA